MLILNKVLKSFFARFGPFDLDALMDYMNSTGPITTAIEQRIQFVTT